MHLLIHYVEISKLLLTKKFKDKCHLILLLKCALILSTGDNIVDAYMASSMKFYFPEILSTYSAMV